MDPHSVTQKKLFEDGTIIISPIHKKRWLNEDATKKRNDFLKLQAKKTKTFFLDSSAKRLIKCSAIRLFHQKKYSVKWFTLTFPSKISQIDANKCLSKFTDNLKNTYNAENYVIVKELHKSGNPHYHCLVDMPFKDFFKLNNAWCHAIDGYCSYSPNAFTTGKEKIIKNIQGLNSYITKYITKAEMQFSDTRQYFISKSALSRPKILSWNEFIYITTTFHIQQRVELEYCTFYFLKNFFYLPEMLLFRKERPQKPPKKCKSIDAFQPNLSF